MFATKPYPSILSRIQGFQELPLAIDVNCRRKTDSTHYHNYTQICYVLAGSMEFTLGNESKLLKSGDSVFILPYQPHYLNTAVSEDTPITVMISFQDTFLTSRGYSFFTHSFNFANFDGMKIPQYTTASLCEKKKTDSLIRAIIAEFSMHFDMSYDKLAEYLVEFMKICCKEPFEIKNTRNYQFIKDRSYAISESIHYMASHYSEKITIEELCSIAAMSRSTYMDTFKSILGESPIKFLTKVRVSQARIYLITTNLSIGEIAVKVGLYDKSRLIHAFKEFYGISPIAMKNAFSQNIYDTYENSKRRWAWIDSTNEQN